MWGLEVHKLWALLLSLLLSTIVLNDRLVQDHIYVITLVSADPCIKNLQNAMKINYVLHEINKLALNIYWNENFKGIPI